MYGCKRVCVCVYNCSHGSTEVCKSKLGKAPGFTVCNVQTL